MSDVETAGNIAVTDTIRAGANPGSVLKRRAKQGLDVASVDWPAHQEHHLTLRPLPGEEPAGMVHRTAVALGDLGATVVRHEVFGSIRVYPETMRALRREFGDLQWPVTWVEGAAAANGDIAGMHVFAVEGAQVETLCLHGRSVGRLFSNGNVRHCLLGDLRPSDPFGPKSAQCRLVLENLECALGEARMSMANLVRTWFFLDDIHSWYGQFNVGRNAFYRQREIFKGLVPASTGVGGRNPAGAAVVAGAWAIQAPEGSTAVREVPSPLQCPSLEYGSAFSRAVLVAEPGLRRVLVSGTASIEPNGGSAHVGNLPRQIGLTMEVVAAILASRGFDFCDVTRATAYFKNIQAAPAFDTWRAEHDLESLPLVVAQADLCRDELLFEIELDAVISNKA